MRRHTQAAVKSRKKRQKVTPIGSGTLSPAQQLGSLGGAARREI
jgi:hypothetical protein